jgi:hypothetical protein
VGFSVPAEMFDALEKMHEARRPAEER